MKKKKKQQYETVITLEALIGKFFFLTLGTLIGGLSLYSMIIWNNCLEEATCEGACNIPITIGYGIWFILSLGTLGIALTILGFTLFDWSELPKIKSTKRRWY